MKMISSRLVPRCSIPRRFLALPSAVNFSSSPHSRAKKKLVPTDNPPPASNLPPTPPISTYDKLRDHRLNAAAWPVGSPASSIPASKKSGTTSSSSRGAFFANLSAEGAAPKQSPISTRQSSKEAFEQLVRDMNDFRETNPALQVEVKNGGTELVFRLSNRPELSFFRVRRGNADDQLEFECPSSPGLLRTYQRNEYGDWNCTEDEHNLHGLLLRDLLPHVTGLPRFAIK